MKIFKLIIISILAFNQHVHSQQILTLENAISLAHSSSPQVQVAQLSFMAQYWSFRSYKAQLLPSLSFNGTIANYNRSLVQVQDFNTGIIRYVVNNMMSNSLGLSFSQNLPFTGGTLSFNTNLYRLDQFTNDERTYNSNPITINYTQPLRAYNELKWKKRTAPKEYEQAKRKFLETTEDITLTTISLFFTVLNAQIEYEESVKKAVDNNQLFLIAQQRFTNGSITQSDLMQLELTMLNSNLAINETRISFDVAIYDLCAYLGIAETNFIRLDLPKNVPIINVDYNHVLNLALTNSSFSLEQQIRILNAEKNVAKAKSLKGLQATFSANLGLSKTAEKFGFAYKDLKDQEIISLTLSMPIFDWGMNKGNLKMAQAQENLIKTEVQLEELKFCQDIRIKVIRFNNQARQCELALKAMKIADERYKISYKRFENGSITVTDLNTAQNEQKKSLEQYINNLHTFWHSYYELQKLTLYDFITNQKLSAEFDI